MLPKAHLISSSKMSGSRWVIIPSWLSGSLRSFLYSSVYSYHLFLISSASVAAAAAKSLQLCPTLCDPIDGSPPGSSVHGIFQARVLEWGAITFSSASVRSILFLSFIEPTFTWNVPLVSLVFLKRSLVFPTLLFSYISLHWSLRKAFLFLLAIFWNSAFRSVYLSLNLCFSSFLSSF